jgi:hypothetical protein
MALVKLPFFIGQQEHLVIDVEVGDGGGLELAGGVEKMVLLVPSTHALHASYFKSCTIKLPLGNSCC